jgi:hypothetical protein
VQGPAHGAGHEHGQPSTQLQRSHDAGHHTRYDAGYHAGQHSALIRIRQPHPEPIHDRVGQPVALGDH